jgi:DNA-binding LytR/AlgR family response regulator
MKKSGTGRQTKQDQIVVPNGLGYAVLLLDEINYIEADGRYVYFYLSNGNKIMASHSIGHYEKLFEDSQFVRIHKSHIANMNKVTRLLTKPILCLELKDGTVLDIASRRKGFVLTMLNA